MYRRSILIAALLFAAAPSSWSFEAQNHHAHKMWYMGRVISVGAGEFAFRTRWHPSRTVHVTDTTAITCAKQKISLAAVRVEDLVEINALADDRDMGNKSKSTCLAEGLRRKTIVRVYESDNHRNAGGA
jgi:hypothetical protein